MRSFYDALEEGGWSDIPFKDNMMGFMGSPPKLVFCLGGDLGLDPNYGLIQEERMGFGRFLLYVQM